MRLIDADKAVEQIDDIFSVDDGRGLIPVGITKALVKSMLTLDSITPTIDGWISVKDKLPELHRYDEDGDTWLMSEPVLVATTKGVTIGFYEDDLDPKFKPGWNDREHGERIRVSHWMELPGPPKENNKGV